MTEPLGATFRRPFSEQVAAYRQRLGNLVPTARWDDIQRNAHDRAFMVAGAAKADLLADLAAAVDEAIAEGTGLDAFKTNFRSIVARRGWHGWTGEGTEAGENWRMRTIYRTNMRTSYMAGRHAQLREGGFKYWVYRHGGSLEPRLHHLAWDGLILPADHPFWLLHYPPNGWGCTCRVFGARSIAGAKRRGGIPGKELQPGWDAIDPKTGTAIGIGKGWDYAPGASTADTVRALTKKSIKWDHVLAKEFMADLPERVVDDFARGYRAQPTLHDKVRRFVQATLDDERQSPHQTGVTLGRLTSRHVDQINALGLDVRGYDFHIDGDGARHIDAKHGNDAAEQKRGQRSVTALDIADIAALLDEPLQIEPGQARRTSPNAAVAIKVIRGGETWNLIFERRRKRRMLALQTFFISSKGL